MQWLSALEQTLVDLTQGKRHSPSGRHQTSSLCFGDGKTINPAPKPYKPADSGVVVGNGERLCSFEDVNLQAVKQDIGVEMQELGRRIETAWQIDPQQQP